VGSGEIFRKYQCLFISPLGIDARGGAGMVTRAYLKALGSLFEQRIKVVAPTADLSRCSLVSADQMIAIGGRGMIDQIAGALLYRAADRLSPAVDRQLEHLAMPNTIAFINSSKAGRFARQLSKRNIPVVTLFHNCEADFVRATGGRSLSRSIRWIAARHGDRIGYQESDGSIFLTENDQQRVVTGASVSGKSRRVLTNGFFLCDDQPGSLDERPAATLQPGGKRLLISCSMGHPQNEPGIWRFLSDVWPQVCAVVADRPPQLTVAGGTASDRITQLAATYQNVTVVQRPSDSQMQQLFVSADWVVSTIEAGSGIKVRVADALRNGCPVVATEHSCIGYRDIDRRVLHRCTFDAMPQMLIQLCRQPSDPLLKQVARKEFDRHLSCASGTERLRSFLASVLQGNRDVALRHR
jgi:hypothetical protein